MKNLIRCVTLLTLAIAAQAAAQDDDDASLLDQTVPVADADTDVADAVSESEPEETEVTEEALAEEFARYRRLVDEGTLDEADVAAKRVVEWAIRIYGPRSSETATALNNLAIVQHRNGQYDAAIQNFTSSVEIIEAVEDRLTSSLVNPLRGLGAAQLGSGRPDLAHRTFNRAAHITQVNEGPHNVEQIEILESMTETLIRMGDLKSARRTLDRIHLLNVRFYEKDPMGLIPSLMDRAAWQHRAGYYNEERASYRRAIRIVESAGDKNDPMLIEPLRRLGRSFYYIDVMSTTPQTMGVITSGEIYFKRAVRIAKKAEDLDYRERAKTDLELADYYTYIESNNRARKAYAEVWEYLSTDDEKLALRNELFGEPVPIRADPLPPYVNSGDQGTQSELRTGRVVVEYDVSARGRVRNLRTVANPPEFTDMQRMVHREIRRRVFRPRAVDGAPVATDKMVFEHEFSYRQSDLDALRAEREEQQDPEQEEDGESQE